MDFETIHFETNGGVARLTLNRPDRLNSFTAEMHEELRRVLDLILPESRVLVITGAGRGFCAGQDLSDRAVAPAGTPVDLGDSIDRNYGPLVKRLRALPMPVICAVNGVAAGAGVQIALACDLVIAAKSASFLEPFCKLGLIPDTGGTYFLPRLVGSARAMGLALLGERISAEEAAQWGLIWKCVDDADFGPTVERTSRQLAQGPTLGFARLKQAFQASHQNTFDEQIDLERDLMSELGRSIDYREGVTAFLEKRTPVFAGR